ncbi:ABC transporter substrate-binding protein [Roseinatronobacter bogoriensis]|uniref:ABC transporter substrate-binding protein n=1 Tax=Roseinatronobacter bogoriensis subsp. barguzinensis TaxID=441209 RepID=A0A2K8KCM3_9RHOB|nr:MULTISPECIES: ABC transporter substrate-binding protein [Rhodobaca]ATX67192.1 ABC transporter substrate-binding protein [Rhodobaca barguzinensis]MBB4206728.1 branched-chain amino acid transport system substrate-binding protein [Rhodobaca bogoriensis DSM 18756]TDW41472.1 amino acid/amide ABC transporter substrate-binding protein (HAAT family) [Rhodobaca barguzinensis]TDY74350.1 amino acid/amide ABC transporter substrate-binding protein (HAAT family) [Rhodobaca bogoriensis DSM 18756]
MKTLRTSALAALTLGAMVGTAQAETVTVGMITTLSGGGAGLGVDVRDGFQLALDMAGEHSIRLVVEDDAQRPELAVQIAERMVQSERADILTGIIWSNLAMAVVPSTVAQDIFYISPNAGPSPLAGANCHPNYFNAAWQNDMLHEAAGQHANVLGYENTFIMAPNYPAGTDALTGFKRYYEGELAGELFTQVGQTDYAAEIAEIRASGADSVFIFLPGGMGISFMRQYEQSGVDLPIVSAGFSFDQDVLPAMGSAALGVINTSQWSPDLDNAANEAFVSAFQQAYDRLPSLYASQGFDTANLILSALSSADISDSDAFRDALRAADFASVRGNFSFAPNHHPVQTVYVREVVEVDGVLTNRIIGTAFEEHRDVHGENCNM